MSLDLYDTVVGILRKHISEMNATSVINTTLRRMHLSRGELNPSHVPDLINSVVGGLRLFAVQNSSVVRAELVDALSQKPDLTSTRFDLKEENDVVVSRIFARGLCERLGARAVVTQKVTTSVSELARNIVLYAGSGSIEFIPSRGGAKTKLTIIATDQGGGIPRLDDILGGKYRSKTGLGKGILGVKNAADSMDIQTGPTGTRITFEVSW